MGESTVGGHVEVRHDKPTVDETGECELARDGSVRRFVDDVAPGNRFQSQSIRQNRREKAAGDPYMCDRPAVAKILDLLTQLRAPQKSGDGPN